MLELQEVDDLAPPTQEFGVEPFRNNLHGVSVAWHSVSQCVGAQFDEYQC